MRGHETQEIVVGMLEQVGSGRQEMETRETTRKLMNSCGYDICNIFPLQIIGHRRRFFASMGWGNCLQPQYPRGIDSKNVEISLRG